MTDPSTGPMVLIIEDEQPIRRFLRATLEADAYRVKEAATALEGLMMARTQRPDIILLDLGLPDGDGLEVTRLLRAEMPTPIIVLSARGQEHDKVSALDAGADDYLTKPFSVSELTARIRVALRHAARSSNATTPIYEASADNRVIRFDPDARRVTITDPTSEHEVRLTPTEFKLLSYFIKYAGKVLTHQQILKDIWGPTHAKDVQYLRVYAGQLRQKLELDPAQPRFLITEPGIGYRFAPPAPQP